VRERNKWRQPTRANIANATDTVTTTSMFPAANASGTRSGKVSAPGMFAKL